MTTELSIIFYFLTILIILIIGYLPPKTRNSSHGGIDGTSFKPYTITTNSEHDTVSKKDVNTLIKNYAEYGITFTATQKNHMLTLPDIQSVIDYIQSFIHE